MSASYNRYLQWSGRTQKRLAGGGDPYREPTGRQGKEAAAKIAKQEKNYTGPEIIDNPYYVPSEEDANTPDSELPLWKRVLPTNGSFENTEVAKGLLARKEYESESQRQRLEQIVESGARSEKIKQRTRMENDADYEKEVRKEHTATARKIRDKINDFSNPLSIHEVNQMKQQLEYNTAVSMFPGLEFLQKSFRSSDNYEVAKATAAMDLVTSLDVPEDKREKWANSILPLLTKDARTNEVENKGFNVAYGRILQRMGKEGTPDNRSAIKDDVRVIEKKMKDIQERHKDLFNDRGRPKPVPRNTDDDFWGARGGNSEERALAEDVSVEWNGLNNRLQKHHESMEGYATGEGPSGFGGLSGGSSEQAEDVKPAYAGPGSAYENPVTADGDMTTQDLIDKADALLQSTGAETIYIKDAHDQVFPVNR